MSGDGNYYKVNVLRRSHNFPAPTATATFSNGAKASVFGPQMLFDESDFPFRYTTPTSSTTMGADPDATVVVTLDLGRVVPLGAMRQYYLDGLVRAPITFQMRVAQTVGQWTTVIPQSGYATADTTCSSA